MNVWGKAGLFAGGVLFGTAGVKILASKDAKCMYTHTVAAVLRAKDCIMATVTKVQENADDILADAKEINENRAAGEGEIVEDCSGECDSVEGRGGENGAAAEDFCEEKTGCCPSGDSEP